MAYFRTYTYSFTDTNEAHPAKWRVDILDDEANAGVVPIELIPSFESLVLERIETSDDKATSIIGRQAVIQYEYTGAIGDPLPELFFDVDERRFRVEVYKNEILYDVFYIKPDSCEYEYKAPPYTVTLTAVDGLSFTKGVIWDAHTVDEALDYRWMSLYDIIIQRGLMQVMDDGIQVNVIDTLKPENIAGDLSILNDLYMHSDMFIDFTKGPDDVYTVLEKVLKQFYLRLFISQNMIWIIRLPDLLQNPIEAENYINGIVNNISLQTVRRSVGTSRTINDATPIDEFARILMFPAIKKVGFNLTYRSINQLSNFQWIDFNGTDFNSWNRFNPVMVVDRLGTGTVDDPYRLFMPYPQASSPSISYLYQNTGNDTVGPGDIVELSFNYLFGNVKAFKLSVRAGTIGGVSPDFYTLDTSGNWVYDFGSEPIYLAVTRSGSKPNGSFSIKSVPIPATTPNGAFPIGIVQIQIFPATDPESLDGSAPTGISIYPIKLGITPISSTGRSITDINNARFSKVLESTEFYFLDTGIDTISNTIAIDIDGTPAKNWSAVGAPTDKQDVERHMSDSIIDQYAKSVYGWEGNLYSNTIEFWNILTFDQLPGRQFVQMTDRYIVNTCTHVTNLQEILPENGADTTYTEIDIEDAND